jgi:hypothetical protein
MLAEVEVPCNLQVITSSLAPLGMAHQTSIPTITPPRHSTFLIMISSFLFERWRSAQIAAGSLPAIVMAPLGCGGYALMNESNSPAA